MKDKIEKLIVDISLQDRFGPLEPGSYVRGVYTFTYYTLRVNPDVREVLRRNHAEEDLHLLTKGEIVVAGSTALHENLHWWQYIGSLSGIVFSLSLPALAICNKEYFDEFSELSGKLKPIIAYAKSLDHKITEQEAPAISCLLDSYMSIYKYHAILKESSKIEELKKGEGFTSVIDVMSKVIFHHLLLLQTTFDEEGYLIPTAKVFCEKINEYLDREEHKDKEGNNEYVPNLNLVDLYEGQARFNQILYIKTFFEESACDWDFFDRAKMLSGKYYNAFSFFLDIVNDGERPDSIESPLVALYLLLIDIAINPAEGFIFDLVQPESFTHDINPAIRFEKLCRLVDSKYEQFKCYIKLYSAEEYWYISTTLCDEIGYISPKKYLGEINGWCKNSKNLQQLIKENDDFSYSDANLPVRMIFGRFLSFQMDKLKSPEIFCWPGMFVNPAQGNRRATTLYYKHQAVFIENSNQEIVPAPLPGIDVQILEDTATKFYQSVTVYDLCNQWAYGEGDFVCDAKWLSNNSGKKKVEVWVKSSFEKVFSFSVDSFTTVPLTTNSKK